MKNAVVLGCPDREVMTIVIAFHGSGFRTFKEFYTLQILPHWKKAVLVRVPIAREPRWGRTAFRISSATIGLWK